MKISPFYIIVSLLTVMLLCLLGYQEFIIEKHPYPLTFVLVGVLLLILIIIVFFNTKPDNLSNAEYRYSKKGRGEWEKSLKEFMNKTKNNKE